MYFEEAQKEPIRKMNKILKLELIRQIYTQMVSSN
jgi:hypothetical protein